MLEKRVAAVMWVHKDSGNLCYALLRATECHQPYNKVAVTFLVVFVGAQIHRA